MQDLSFIMGLQKHFQTDPTTEETEGLGNGVALVYGIVMGVCALIAFPLFMLAAIFAPAEEFGVAGVGFAVVFMLVYPVMGLVMGWISGLLTSAIYNLIVRWTGGLLLEFDSGAGSSSDAVV